MRWFYAVMKILFVIPKLHHGGTNRVLGFLLPLLNQEKYDISILSLGPFVQGDDYYYQLFSRNYKLLFLPKRYQLLIVSKFFHYLHAVTKIIWGYPYFLWLNFKYAAEYIEKLTKPSVVISFEESNPSIFCQYFRCRKISWIHCDYSLYVDIANPNIKYETLKYSLYNQIVCVTNYSKNSFCSYFPSLFNRVSTIYNPLNINKLIEMSKEVICDHKFHNDIFTIISIGRYAEVKQFHFIPDIMHKMDELYKDKLNYVWFIIGDGCSDLIVNTEKKIVKYGLEGKLILLGRKDNPYKYLKKSNLLVSTSYSETYSYVINEAKALKIPVVSNYFPAVEEVLDAESGIISNFERLPLVIADMILNRDNIYKKIKNSVHLQNINQQIRIDVENLLDSKLTI